MKELIRMPMGHYWSLIGCTSAAIFIATLEVITKVKNPDFYQLWLTQMGNPQIEGAFSVYLTVSLTHYAAIVIIPMTFAIYTTFAANKLRINGLYIFMWIVLMLASLAYSVLGKMLDDGFLYAFGVVYGGIVITLMSLVEVVREPKLK